MWIPVITILWALGDGATWVNFPMVNFPFSSSETCYGYIDNARAKITQDPQYLNGYSTCVYIGSPTGTSGEPTWLIGKKLNLKCGIKDLVKELILI